MRMINEEIILKGRIGTEPKFEKKENYIYFNINTSSISEPRWWRIILYNIQLSELQKLLQIGKTITVKGQPEFYSWNKVNKKGNTILSKVELDNQMKATIFVRRTCITTIEQLSL